MKGTLCALGDGKTYPYHQRQAEIQGQEDGIKKKKLLFFHWFITPSPNFFVLSVIHKFIILFPKRIKAISFGHSFVVSYLNGILYVWNQICFSPVTLCYFNLIIKPAKECGKEDGKVLYS